MEQCFSTVCPIDKGAGRRLMLRDWRSTCASYYGLRCGVCESLPQNWDGSGGNGAAMRHYEATGSRYPLVVKLGTITPHGADVYSYASDENDMVLDPHLVRSLPSLSKR